ncbi:MAG: hypothetical protein ACREOG_10200, partial [Gemmatimonadaceae bacterium]
AAAAHLPGGSYCGIADRSAIFVSDNSGSSWGLRCIVETSPRQFTADPSLRLLKDELYLAYLFAIDFGAGVSTVRLASAGDFLSDPVMTKPFEDWPRFDQPQLQTWPGSTEAGAVGFAASDMNTLAESPIVCHAGVVLAADPALGPWMKQCIAFRSGYGGHFGSRLSAHQDGTLFAAYQRVVDFPRTCVQPALVTCYEGDVVVLRGDPEHMESAPLAQLEEKPAAGSPTRCEHGGDPGLGTRPARCRILPNDYTHNEAFGQERRSSPQLALAVHPANSRRVYVAWADSVPGVLLRLHVSTSEDGGETWTELSGAEVNDATNPTLAITEDGRLGFLYQQIAVVDGKRFWHTRLIITQDDFVSKSTYRLADTPAWIPTADRHPYIGDYVDLVAVNKTFYGVFSASNERINSTFPCGVTILRNVTATDLRDPSGLVMVPPSIDPYFFRVSTASGLPREC